MHRKLTDVILVLRQVLGTDWDGFHLLACAAGNNDTDQLNDSNADGRAADLVDVFEKLILHLGEATHVPQLVGSGSSTTILYIHLAAAVRRLAKVGGVPLREVVNPTALQLPLDEVPGVGYSIVVGLAIVLHALNHLLVYLAIQVVLEEIGSDARCDLSHQHDEEEGGVRVDHAAAVLRGTEAAKERDQEDHNAHYDEENRCVGVLIPEEVEVLGGLDLDEGAESDEGQTSDDEDKVEDEKEGSPETHATTHDVF